MVDETFDFHWQHNEFEVRVTHRLFSGSPYIELVRWEKKKNDRPSCYTIAYWYRGDEGWDLRFVGDRMLELARLDIGSIWPQLCAAQICLSEWEDRKKGERIF